METLYPLDFNVVLIANGSAFLRSCTKFLFVPVPRSKMFHVESDWTCQVWICSLE